MVIRDNLTESLLQENLALNEKVKSLLKMLKKDRLKIKDLEAKIYENSVDMEIEKELNKTLEKSPASTQFMLKREQNLEEEEVVIDVEDDPPIPLDSGEEEALQGNEAIKYEPSLVARSTDEQDLDAGQQSPMDQVENERDKTAPDSKAEKSLVRNAKGKFQCNTCNAEHTSQTYIKNHIMGMHNGHKWKCNLCEKEFNSPYVIKKHKDTNHKEMPSIIYSTSEEAIIGQDKEPSEPKEVRAEQNVGEGMSKYYIEKNSEGMFQCKICKLTHVSIKRIRFHIMGVHEGFRWKCNECEKEYSSPYKMNQHKSQKHNAEENGVRTVA